MTTITENDKQHLNNYLIDTVIMKLSGRDGRDLLDVLPSRTIFAGVLQVPRQSEVKGAHISSNDAPVGTALGIDFRVKPTMPGGSVSLKICPRWSLYYPVFPTYQEALGANDLPHESSGNSPDTAALLNAEGDSGSAEDIDTEDESEAGDNVSVLDTGVVILPRKWRRSDVKPRPATIEINGVMSIEEFALPEIEAAVSEARVSMVSDPDIWRHLADPKKRERSPGNRSIIVGTDAYSKALSSASPPVSLPNWSANILIDVALEPEDSEVFRVRVLLANTTPEGVDVPDPALEERALFDGSLEIEIEGGSLVPFDFWLAPKDYRSDPKLPAKGINCTALWDGEPKLLRTETLPIFRQPLYRTRDVIEVRFEHLDVDDATTHLEGIAAAMDSYLTSWDDFVANAA